MVEQEKNPIFANDEEPSALATDVGKYIPPLSGSDASRFIEMMRKNSEYYEQHKDDEPTKEELEKTLAMKKVMLKFQEENIRKEKEYIKKLEEKLNGFKKEG